jgi:hypothetical protein
VKLIELAREQVESWIEHGQNLNKVESQSLNKVEGQGLVRIQGQGLIKVQG